MPRRRANSSRAISGGDIFELIDSRGSIFVGEVEEVASGLLSFVPPSCDAFSCALGGDEWRSPPAREGDAAIVEL